MSPPELGEALGGSSGLIDHIVEAVVLIGADEVEEPSDPEWEWFSDLQQAVKTKGRSPIEFLPVLGCEGYIRKARSHLLASYPKGGKTELVVNILMGWEQERILYISEEDREIWRDRAYELPDWPNDMMIAYALGWKREKIMKAMEVWDGSVVVIDTIKVLGIEDENDSATVQAALTPFIVLARKRKQTLVFVHHDNKHGGKGGRGISGSHAFVGIVDIFLEIDEVKGQETQRVLSGRGKIRNIQGLLYEKSQDDGLMKALSTDIQETELKVFGEVAYDWLSTAEIAKPLELSSETVLKYLRGLAQRGTIDREPPIQEQAKGKVVLWRRKAGRTV